MFECFIFAVVLFLAVSGLAELLHKLWIYCLTPKGKAHKNFLFTTLFDETAPQQMRADLQKIHWNGNSEYCGLICLDVGLDNETLNICRRIANENRDVCLISSDDAAYIISRLNF